MAMLPKINGRMLHQLREPINTKGANVVVGIRREDPKRIWERRSPLTPDAVHHLLSKQGVRVHVEPCDRRVFPVSEYVKAGALVKDTLDAAHILVGIKETPINELITSPRLQGDLALPRTHLMFSHTAKGQPYNTPLLSRFLETPGMSHGDNIGLPRLIDYELLTNEVDQKRTVGFGWFAGVAGVLESLSAMAHSHLEIGIASPFLYTPRPHTLPSLEQLRAALRDIGNRISNEGTPSVLGPFVIGLTGTGNVAQGCLSMLSELPIVKVDVKDLHALVVNKETDLRKIYLVHAHPKDYFQGLDGRQFDREHYYTSPQSYRSTFAETVAPYLTLFLNGTGWSPSYPRLMTNEQLTVALDRSRTLGGARFTNIGDISCDVEGGLQFLTRSSTLSSPFYKTRPSSLPADLPDVQMMAVDILPASIPLDASNHFSQTLLPYLESVIEGYQIGIDNRTDAHTLALKRATICEDGRLVEKHKWLQSMVDTLHEKQALAGGSQGVVAPEPEAQPADKAHSTPHGTLRKKNILMLGSGMVASPAVEEIAKRGDVQLVIASNSLAEVEKLAGEYLNVQYRVIDMAQPNMIARLIEETDVVISLLPAAFHVKVAEMCIVARKHLVTASYISDDMKKLNDRAKKAGVLLLNEIGLDPGIDHCSAISLVNRFQAQNMKIKSFTSFCGGLPAPDVPLVPLRYKFSWSPKGVLSAALNSAKFKLNDEICHIDGSALLKDHFPNVPITKDFDLEGIANRDSLPYAETYNLGGLQSLRTVLRGTLRYPGFSNLMDSFKTLGLLNTDAKVYLDRWTSLVPQSLFIAHGDKFSPQSSEAAPMIKDIIPPNRLEALHEALEWLSLIPSATGLPSGPMPPLPSGPMAPIDIFAYLLSHKLRYERNERDMVILSHEFVVQGYRGPEVHTSSLITYGTPKASAMARTVGLPVAFAALGVLDGRVDVRGVTGPKHASIYEPVLRGLEEVGLGMTESRRKYWQRLEKQLGFGPRFQKKVQTIDNPNAFEALQQEADIERVMGGGQ